MQGKLLCGGREFFKCVRHVILAFYVEEVSPDITFRMSRLSCNVGRSWHLREEEKWLKTFGAIKGCIRALHEKFIVDQIIRNFLHS
jgi:hypothetical protein